MGPRLFVYGLIDQRTGQIRYVGQTRRGTARLNEYRQPSNLFRRRGHVWSWLKSTQGGWEHVILQEAQSVDELNEAEAFWISYFVFVGCNLTNTTAGGDTPVYVQPMSDERRKAARLAENRMTIERYMRLRAELAAVRARGADSPDEDRLLGEMDDAWWQLPERDQQQIRVLLAVASHPRIEFVRVAPGRSMTIASSQSTQEPQSYFS